MCIAVPCKVVAVVDFALMQVSVTADDGTAPEIVSAALLVTPEQPVSRLVGAFVLIHAGFAISLIDEAEARSRQQVFAALRGGTDAIDLDDFYASTTDVAAVPGVDAERRPLPDAGS
ncbi:MAG TPA: HypC/HybG/HupF family hydrogenase formation chaperone [Rhodopseudomonas sp.]|uniref:HypC/HybG/HupF family hydrogenase formation chaperone n=1 Tax=Rhodopseudomonas sp. TaxID=1078 RepID=UPI002EDAC83F